MLIFDVLTLLKLHKFIILCNLVGKLIELWLFCTNFWILSRLCLLLSLVTVALDSFDIVRVSELIGKLLELFWTIRFCRLLLLEIRSRAINREVIIARSFLTITVSATSKFGVCIAFISIVSVFRVVGDRILSHLVLKRFILQLIAPFLISDHLVLMQEDFLNFSIYHHFLDFKWFTLDFLVEFRVVFEHQGFEAFKLGWHLVNFCFSWCKRLGWNLWERVLALSGVDSCSDVFLVSIAVLSASCLRRRRLVSLVLLALHLIVQKPLSIQEASIAFLICVSN